MSSTPRLPATHSRPGEQTSWARKLGLALPSRSVSPSVLSCLVVFVPQLKTRQWPVACFPVFQWRVALSHQPIRPASERVLI